MMISSRASSGTSEITLATIWSITICMACPHIRVGPAQSAQLLTPPRSNDSDRPLLVTSVGPLSACHGGCSAGGRHRRQHGAVRSRPAWRHHGEHPRTPTGRPEHELLTWIDGYRAVVPPLGDSDGRASFTRQSSGRPGPRRCWCQEHRPFGTPVLVTPESTERIEGLESGSAVLAGTDTRRIVKEATALLSTAYRQRVRCRYGGEHAAERAAAACVRFPETSL
ncbi:UDP-N-acetylglucosamine 2-epimerase [Streptomyces sp. NPDC058067]|uniref:UDP-N-acetylglucosamine 2-epimerase n=1 Tax=Streptomyces sp. NPDC058067 TaxID=3346324 RepID=UPI0036E28F0C